MTLHIPELGMRACCLGFPSRIFFGMKSISVELCVPMKVTIAGFHSWIELSHLARDESVPEPAPNASHKVQQARPFSCRPGAL